MAEDNSFTVHFESKERRLALDIYPEDEVVLWGHGFRRLSSLQAAERARYFCSAMLNCWNGGEFEAPDPIMIFFVIDSESESFRLHLHVKRNGWHTVLYEGNYLHARYGTDNPSDLTRAKKMLELALERSELLVERLAAESRAAA
jgi:hypothetical protein